jgi:hypothetical protein
MTYRPPQTVRMQATTMHLLTIEVLRAELIAAENRSALKLLFNMRSRSRDA